MVDKVLLSAFAERWHRETSTFHLPFGEMTITLDDVSCLLHVPITGTFISFLDKSRDLACDYLVDLLGVTRTEALMEMNQNRGLHVRFSWLLDVYNDWSQEEHLDCAVRAFLMYLIGCTLFPDKSATYIDIVYLDLFRDLTQCITYAWGAATLTYLYEHLGDASIHSCKQLGGYLTLLQAWIFEHFPSLGSRRLNSGYTEDQPRASHWIPVRGAGTVIPCRASLDQLTIDDVYWMPYADHREYHPFQDISLYSGYIRCGGLMRPHLSERVLRQYGHVQGSPRSPRTITDEPMSTAEIDDWWQHYGDHLVDDATRGPRVTHPGQCVDAYMQWFHRISHPYVTPPAEGDPPRVPVIQPVRIPESSSSAPVSATVRLERVSEILQSMIDRGMVTEGTEAWDVTRQALNISLGGILRTCISY